MLTSHPAAEGKAQYCEVEGNAPFDKGILAERMVEEMLPAIESSAGGQFNFNVVNCDRSIGARVSVRLLVAMATWVWKHIRL